MPLSHSLGYSLARSLAAFVRNQCIVEFVLNRRQLQRQGGFIVACTHLSHLEPALVSVHSRRPIYWLARVEFFRVWWFRPFLKLVRAISVNRQGVAAAAIRRAIRLARRGEIVGIFPEGGVAHGPAAIIRGGPMKRGVCVIAMHAGVPIIPCVVLGFDQLTRVSPWLPAKRGRVWVAYGDPIYPPAELPSRSRRREARFQMADQLQAAFATLYAQLLERANLSDTIAP